VGTTASVVICAYTTDRWEQLQAAVRSVLDQMPRPEQVLVVVDHCHHLLLRAEDAFAGSGVAVLPNAQVKGLSGARNTGTARATGDVVVFLDDDAVAQPGWLAGHLGHFDDPDVLGVGGLVVPWWQTEPPRWFPEEFGWVVGCSYLGQPTVTAPVRNPIGANMSFRRSVIDEVGGFSQSLGRVGTTPEGCEETELAIRAGAAHPHGRILHEPGAAVRHHVPAARGTWSYFRRRCWAEGRSKARMSRMASASGALGSERAYVRSVLPSGVRRNLLEAARQRDVAHLLRAAAICAGLAITAGGFATGQLLATRLTRGVAPHLART
jgi:glycosyltransferase involved in cell wall biosynthesis